MTTSESLRATVKLEPASGGSTAATVAGWGTEFGLLRKVTEDEIASLAFADKALVLLLAKLLKISLGLLYLETTSQRKVAVFCKRPKYLHH